MRERKYIKIKVDMFEDTKFKIIDSMEERDTIHYIWTRILALCGKINNEEGDLFVSKDIPYTLEILSLEFNRSEEQIKNALEVFIRLNMMSKDEKLNVFKVCNWGKHQGIRKNKKEKVEENKQELKSENEKNNENEKKYINLIDYVDNKKDVVALKKVSDEELTNKAKIKKKKGRKKKTDEILVSDEEADESEISGFDIPPEKLGKLVSSFNFT